MEHKKVSLSGDKEGVRPYSDKADLLQALRKLVSNPIVTTPQRKTHDFDLNEKPRPDILADLVVKA